MNKLPNEIFHSIFIQVSFKERLECMFVCHHWYNILLNHSLLYDVQIGGMKRFENFVDMMQQMPYRGAQVEILDLAIVSDDGFDYQKLCTMLPNLRKIRFEDQTWKEPNQSFWNEPFEFQTIDSKLEEIKDSGDYQLARYLIMTNSCTRLTSLELDLYGIEDARKEFFVYLENIPLLKNLQLHHVGIGIEDCEIVHTYLPALETFRLENVRLNSSELPSNITPASSVKTFSMYIHEVKSFITYLDWSKYLANKYTNLTDFRSEDLYISTVSQDQAMEIYQDAILPFYKNTIRKQFVNFNAINVPTEVDIFNKLSEFGVRFESFNIKDNGVRPIFTQLAESKLARYATYIYLVSTIISSPILLQNFTSLISIEIMESENEYWREIDLTDYFNGFPPALTSFKGYFTDAKISELPTHSNNIQEFTLGCETIYPKLGEAISNFFPKLNKLTLQGLVVEDLSINLPDHHLKELNIDAYFYGNLSHLVLITDSTSSQTQYYIDGSRLIDPLESKDNEKLQDRVNINLEYSTASLKDLNSYSIG